MCLHVPKETAVLASLTMSKLKMNQHVPNKSADLLKKKTGLIGTVVHSPVTFSNTPCTCIWLRLSKKIFFKSKNICPKRPIFSENFQHLDKAMACLASGAGRKYHGVARVHCALAKETFLRPLLPKQKTTQLSENRCKSEEEAKEENLL